MYIKYVYFNYHFSMYMQTRLYQLSVHWEVIIEINVFYVHWEVVIDINVFYVHWEIVLDIKRIWCTLRSDNWYKRVCMYIEKW